MIRLYILFFLNIYMFQLNQQLEILENVKNFFIFIFTVKNLANHLKNKIYQINIFRN